MTDTTSKSFSIGLIQMKMQADAAANLAHALELIAQAAKKGANIVVLPELFSSRYFAQEEKADEKAEPIPGPTSKALSECAKKNKIVLVGGSIYEQAKDKNKCFNTACVFLPDGLMAARYRKTHIPQDEGYYEKDYFAPGDSGFVAADTPFGRVAPLICYDQWFPEAARGAVLLGADLIAYPTAIGHVDGIEETEGDWHNAWETVMRGHAIANGVAVAACNRAGTEGRTHFWGGSFVCDAFGKVLARGGEDEEIVMARIDPKHGKNVREGWGFLRNRRPEMYKKLIE